MSAIVWANQTRFAAPPDSFLDDLTKRLKGRVEQAFVFGSYGTPNYRPGSDVDILLVTRTALPFVERPRLFDDLYDLFPRLDVLVYEPHEFATSLFESSGFWRSVRESLRELPIND